MSKTIFLSRNSWGDSKLHLFVGVPICHPPYTPIITFSLRKTRFGESYIDVVEVRGPLVSESLFLGPSRVSQGRGVSLC